MFDRAEERPRRDADLFTFEFWSPKASFGGHIALLRRPSDGVLWYSTAVFRAGEPLVALADEFPLTSGLELRGNGLWADHNLEDPFVHWSVGLEAFALALDDPADDRGIRVPLGFDLEWELDPDVIAALDDGYEQPGRVHGEVLLGADAYELDGLGWRTHRGMAAVDAAGGERRTHGIDAAGAPQWSTGPAPAEAIDLGWAQAVTAVGTLRKELWRSEVGAGGFRELWSPIG